MGARLDKSCNVANYCFSLFIPVEILIHANDNTNTSYPLALYINYTSLLFSIVVIRRVSPYIIEPTKNNLITKTPFKLIKFFITLKKPLSNRLEISFVILIPTFTLRNTIHMYLLLIFTKQKIFILSTHESSVLETQTDDRETRNG